MHQYLGYIGSFPIRSYSLIFVLAIVLGIGVTVTLAKLQKKEHLAEHLLNLSVPMIIGAIVGSRFWTVFFFDWDFYSKHPAEIIAVWHGGLSIQGGVSVNDPKVFDQVKKHLSFLEKMGHPSTPQDFLNQTEFFIADDFHRNMLEQWQVGYSYYLNKVAANYLRNGC